VKFGAQDLLVKGKFDSKLLISSVIYSFERFNLNKKIRNVSTQLSDGQIRFDNLQHLANIGYFELDFTTNKFFVSKHTAHELGLGDVTNISVEEALEKFIDKGSFDKAIEEIRAGTTKGERIFYNRILDRELFVRWDKLNDVFAAIVYYYRSSIK
jgi:hypothetical protein